MLKTLGKKFFDKRKGNLTALKTVTRQDGETFLPIEGGELNNDGPNEQQIITPRLEQENINVSDFDLTLSEKVDIDTSFKVLGSGVDINLEVGSEQHWHTSKTEDKTKEYPSQTFNVSPYSFGRVDQSIKSYTLFNQGMARYDVKLDDTIDSSYFWSKTGVWEQAKISIKDLIKELNDHGYGDLIKDTSKEFSVISTDNPDNPSWATLNLPVSWKLEKQNLSLHYTETDL